MAKSTAPSSVAMSAMAVLEKPDALEQKPVYAVFGDEEYLRSSVIDAIRASVLGADGDEFGVGRFDGKTAALADLLDELATLPFLAPRRLVVLSNADPFVTSHREALERYVEKPHRTGVLVFVAQSWPSNTRLAKSVARNGLAIDCKAPDTRQLAPWCRRWAKDQYHKKLGVEAADLLVELVGGGLGQLSAEIDKLASYVGERPELTADDVDRLVAAGRVETVWKILDAAAAGDAATAVNILESLMSAGEQPVLIFGAISSQLRKLAKAHRLVVGGHSIQAAIPKAGINFYTDRASAHLRRLGRERLGRLFAWLTETDMGIKGDSNLPPRHLLERLVVRVAGS
jgi:DNA polymerase-3 subunit delta